MKQTLAVLVCCLLIGIKVEAQSKIFKEVNDEISSETRAILQDGALVGYLTFVQLEKASQDSFNYKVSIMDENLNDLGNVTFRDQKLFLQAVAFEQDVLCLAYFKSNIVGKDFGGSRSLKKASATATNAVVTQFLSLNGKILKNNSIPVSIKVENSNAGSYSFKAVASGGLKHPVRMTNIQQKGFVCLFGDKDNSTVVGYSANGTELWKKTVDDAEYYNLLTANNDVYILSKKKDKMLEGGYELNGLSASDGVSFDKRQLKDKDGNSLKVLNFSNDLTSGRPYLTGNIINHSTGNNFYEARHILSGPYSGVFTINLNGRKKDEVNEVYSYWSDGSQKPAISTRGHFLASDVYSKFSTSIRDFQGNTYFAGSSLKRKIKWGTIASGIIFLPLSPFIIGMVGTRKCMITDATLLKQDAKGALTVESEIPCNHTSYFRPTLNMWEADAKSFYNVSNSNTKTNYLIVDDTKDIVIYNMNTKKVARTVSHKEGKVRTNIFPAKEGHIMVMEYNKKEKYTRLSIEAL